MTKQEWKMIIAVLVMLAAFAVVIPQLPEMIHSFIAAVAK